MNAVEAARDRETLDDDFFPAVVQRMRGRSLAAGVLYRRLDRKSTRLNSSHLVISYAVFCLKKKLRKCSSKIITSILSFISGRLATKSNQIKQLIRNGRSASLQRTFKKSFTSFSHSTRNKTRDGLIRVRNIRALNFFLNTSIPHASTLFPGSTLFP